MVDPPRAESPRGDLLRRWVLANALGEFVGLGGVALLAAALVPPLQRALPGTVAARLATALLMMALGALEGWVVGSAQARALAPGPIDRSAWVRATVLGAVLAWAVGMVPSTVLALRHVPGGAAPGGPPPGLRLALAAGLGLVAGPILAAVQVRVLRPHVSRPAGWWLVACALGWALGMPCVFAAVHLLVRNGVRPWSLVGAAVALGGAGALVGLVEGLFLVRLLGPRGAARTAPEI